MTYRKTIGAISIVSGALLLAGCSSEGGAEDTEEANLGEQMDYTITGIEPGAGLTGLARESLEVYDNLEGWELQESSTAGMLTQLEQAIQNEEPIVVTGWAPHWMFERYDLKMLEDPELALGEEEQIHTIARTGLENDLPDAYAILDAFNWEVEDMQEVMLEAQDTPFEEVAADWIEDNRDKVDEWVAGTEPVNGEAIQLVSTPWDSERASANVMKLVLEEQGYSVTITSVDPAIIFQSIATGEADASLAPWLPSTHGAFMEEYGEDIDDLGENLGGAVNAFTVPEYMEIDSIEDLPSKD
ncbi:glycine/betaine ABC transporter [Marinilactibacillus sp. 15R]|uniref:Glycine betaine/proline transport system substrate-binding protein n=1 Tax=Marinilactibacillus piezotolerans TaxID=258723 RepID=A0A1I3XKR9_9LACT|nr:MULTISPECIES: glycine betaine ABC transporter substrate-binding protein [Marinilactibacillus]API88245.1 glycine/betaine ABC transporter [Marinilactibacillus sp. 15R]SFK19646.1 glycine betaine/proline transport system substrate-binding protein [Marinilactibacillus piezotolerans]